MIRALHRWYLRLCLAGQIKERKRAVLKMHIDQCDADIRHTREKLKSLW